MEYVLKSNFQRGFVGLGTRECDPNVSGHTQCLYTISVDAADFDELVAFRTVLQNIATFSHGV